MKSSLLMLPMLVVATVAGLTAYRMKAHGQQPAKAEKEKLKGDWILVSNESRGFIAQIFGQVPEPAKIGITTFSDNQMTVTIDGHLSSRPTYNLDPTTVPKTVDLTFAFGRVKKATCQGIYELDGNNLKMCFDMFCEARPTAFPVKAKDPDKEDLDRRSVLVLRRIGADPKQDALDQNKAQCARNLVGLHATIYMHVEFDGRYPPAAIYSKDGQPLLSWRVAILELMGEDTLLKEFKTDEPWDSAHNKKLIRKMPKIYALPGVETKEPGMTFYQVFNGKGTIFEGKKGLKLTDRLNSLGNYFMIVEAGEPIPWTKPDDLPYNPRKPLPKLGRLSDEGFFAAFTSVGFDKVQFIPKSTTEKKLRSLIQRPVIDEKENQREKTP